jgi:hypothetical protein
MGPQMIAWIKLLCTNRRACIILGIEKLGSVFNLERGNAQGDVISPFLFNICYQIVLLKLELDLQIKDGLDLPVPVPVVPNFTGAGEDQLPVRYIAKRVFAFVKYLDLSVMFQNLVYLASGIVTFFRKI